MKIKFSLFAVAATLFLSGYKEHAANDNGHRVSKQLVQTSIRTDQAVSFNADGTLNNTSWLQGGILYVRSFKYTPGVVQYVLIAEGKKKEAGEYKLADNKAQTLQWYSFDERGDTSAHYLESFTYNKDGLLEKHQFNRSWSEYSYDKDKNMVRAAHFNAAGKPTTIIEYTYTKSRDLFPSLNYFHRDGNGFFLPAFSKFLPATKKVTRVANGEVTLKGKFNYKLDTDGYVLEGKWDAVSAGDADHAWSNKFQ